MSKKTDDKFDQYDQLQDKLHLKNKHLKIHKVSGKSVFRLEKIMQDKAAKNDEK